MGVTLGGSPAGTGDVQFTCSEIFVNWVFGTNSYGMLLGSPLEGSTANDQPRCRKSKFIPIVARHSTCSWLVHCELHRETTNTSTPSESISNSH